MLPSLSTQAHSWFSQVYGPVLHGALNLYIQLLNIKTFLLSDHFPLPPPPLFEAEFQVAQDCLMLTM